MEETGWARATVWRYLKEAQDAGIVEERRRARRPSTYQLHEVQTGELHASYKRFLNRLWPGLVHEVRERRDTPGGYADPEVMEVIDQGPLPGRAKELKEIEHNTLKGANTLIVGWEGYGKTHLLRHLSENGITRSAPADVMIHFTIPGPPKDFLLRMGEELFKVGDLLIEIDEEDDPYTVLNKLKIRPLYELVRDSLSQSRNRYLLLIDDIDQITPRQKAMLQELLELRNVQVIATAKSQKPSLSSLWPHFFPVELGRLPREVSDHLVEEFLEEHGIPVADDGRRSNRELLKERLYRRSRGNPRRLKLLLRRIELTGYVDRAYLQKELGAEEDEPYIDMTWFIIATAAIIMAIRYLGLGLHDRELYILAGTGYAATLILRYLSYRWRR